MDYLEGRDNQIRAKSFEWLSKQVTIYGDVLPRTLLQGGFEFEDTRVHLISQQGIFKPRALKLPISITTVIAGPYDDGFKDDRLLSYRYRGKDPHHRDNVGLRLAMKYQVPLIYFHAVAKGKYLAVWPVFIVGDDPANLTFTVAVDDARFLSEQTHEDWDALRVADVATDQARRSYITTLVRQRLHQRSFRERILHAYREQCAFCRLKHRELLDAAHIIPDNEPGGEPVITNGLALCKLHHAAFDRNFLGVRPDHIIEVRSDVLHEQDGPMLQHGLQDLNNQKLIVPSRKIHHPNPELLLRRYERFKSAS